MRVGTRGTGGTLNDVDSAAGHHCSQSMTPWLSIPSIASCTSVFFCARLLCRVKKSLLVRQRGSCRPPGEGMCRKHLSDQSCRSRPGQVTLARLILHFYWPYSLVIINMPADESGGGDRVATGGVSMGIFSVINIRYNTVHP